MSGSYKCVGLALAAMLASAGGSEAAILLSFPNLTSALASPGSVTVDFNLSQSADFLRFSLQGYASLDGVHEWEDDFTLTVNGTEVLALSYDLGGGGVDTVFHNPLGATLVKSPFPGGTQGGWNHSKQLLVTISAPNLFQIGANSVVLAYDSPTTSPFSGLTDLAGAQGIDDEGWGVGAFAVAVTAVPEPSAWTMMLVGFAGLGFSGHRASRRAAAAA